MTLVRSVPLCASSPDRAFAACNCPASAEACADDFAVDVAPPAAVPGDEPGLLLEESTTAVTAMTTRAATAIAGTSGLLGRVILPKVSGRFWSAIGAPSGPNCPPGPYSPGGPYCPPGPYWPVAYWSAGYCPCPYCPGGY